MNRISKALIFPITFGISVSSIIPTISCNSASNLSFYNYEDYMNPDLESSINKHYNASSFSDLPELENYIDQQSMSYGIGSDYFNAKLAHNNKIQIIDFHKAIHLDYKNQQELKNKLMNIYTKQTWDLMSSFDSYVPKGHHLYEYMIPYFIQYKTIVFNWKRMGFKNAHDGKLFADKLKNKTYKKILTAIKNVSIKNNVSMRLNINDYMRDNMMIGSESEDGSIFTGSVTSENYKCLINNFKSMIKQVNPKYSKFESSGSSILNSLIDPHSNWNVALIYNGDALDAYYGSDNDFGGVKNGEVISITPKNPSFLLDGTIIPKYIVGQELDDVYNSIYKNIYYGINEKNINEDKPLYKNFDYVNYTSPFALLDRYIQNNYFNEDNIAKSIYNLPLNISPKNHVALPIIDNDLFENVSNTYDHIKLNW